jgi:hypothetical protein
MDSPTTSATPGTQPPTTPAYVATIDVQPWQGRIGRYRVEAVLGEGGCGRVYLAFDEELQRRVAVKVPRLGPEHASLFLAEARTLAQLDHPHIVPVHDVGTTDEGSCYVVSKFIQGSDLAKRMVTGRPSFTESAALVAGVAEALHYAHLRGVVHRDVKPGNVLLDASGKPFLADFGIALKEKDFGKGTAFTGTPAYMSPEQARGEGQLVDGRSDIFSLGVVLYELLTGRRPFRGETREEVLDQILRVEPRPPRQIDDTIPPELERICLKALAKRPADRYTTARDLADELAQAARSSARPTFSLRGEVGRLGCTIAVSLCLLAMVFSAWWVHQHTASRPSKREQKPWLPPGFKEGKDAGVKSGLYERIVYPLEGAEVEFLLILPTEKGRDVSYPFYIMRDKVTVKQFQAALKSPAMRKILADSARGGREWTVRDDKVLLRLPARANQPNLPMRELKVVEAHCFAQLLGGKLPKISEWDKAGGEYDGAEGPFDPAWNKTKEGIAVGRSEPAPVGTSRRDISRFGCRDMAGNGREFTRDIDDRPDEYVPLRNPQREDRVSLRGNSYTRDEPFRFNLAPNTNAYGEEPAFDVGFRVVIDRLGASSP